MAGVLQSIQGLIAFPVWRPRPLFNGRIVFQTRFNYANMPEDLKPQLAGGVPSWLGNRDAPFFEVVQAPPGLLLNSPSANPGNPRGAEEEHG